MTEYKVGALVRHATFGEGVVIRTEGEGAKHEAEICFDDAGHKRLLVGWAPLVAITERARRPRLDSPLEVAFYDALPSHLKSAVTTQHQIGKYRVDFAFTDSRVVVEVDGKTYHSDEKAFTKDRKRDRDLTAQGWRVLRFASDEVFADATKCTREVATHVGGPSRPTLGGVQRLRSRSSDLKGADEFAGDS